MRSYRTRKSVPHWKGRRRGEVRFPRCLRNAETRGTRG
jgi:hypothetical protein